MGVGSAGVMGLIWSRGYGMLRTGRHGRWRGEREGTVWRTRSEGAGRRETGSLGAVRLPRVHGAVCVRAVLVQHTFIQIRVPSAEVCTWVLYR